MNLLTCIQNYFLSKEYFRRYFGFPMSKTIPKDAHLKLATQSFAMTNNFTGKNNFKDVLLRLIPWTKTAKSSAALSAAKSSTAVGSRLLTQAEYHAMLKKRK